MTDQSLTISEFCAVEKLSRSQLYKLWHQGKGPRFYKIGNRPRISPEARREWRLSFENEAESKLAAPRTSTSEAA